MTNELKIQSLIVADAVDAGAHAFKCNNRFLKGVLDLSIQMPGMSHVYIEVKYEKSFKMARAPHHAPYVTLDLTPHQRRFIVDHSEAGGCAGWMMVVNQGNGRFLLECSMRTPSSMTLYHGPEEVEWMVKERGGKWPIKQIVSRLQR